MWTNCHHLAGTCRHTNKDLFSTWCIIFFAGIHFMRRALRLCLDSMSRFLRDDGFGPVGREKGPFWASSSPAGTESELWFDNSKRRTLLLLLLFVRRKRIIEPDQTGGRRPLHSLKHTSTTICSRKGRDSCKKEGRDGATENNCCPWNIWPKRDGKKKNYISCMKEKK